MKLSERKKKILQYVVGDYISSAQPVSSKSITEKYMPDVSSATVRSELAGLEEMGYLIQPHTSSGRVPSIDAYKLYVYELMDKGKLTVKEVGAIKSAFKDHTDNLENVVQSAVKVISDLTDYTSIAYKGHDKGEKVLKVQLFRCKPTQALLLIVTENTFVRDKFITLNASITDKQIAEASEMISKLFVGKRFEEIIGLSEAIEMEFDAYREIFDRVMDAIEDYYKTDGGKLVIDGEDKILNHPEYNDSENIKNFLTLVSSKDKLANLLTGEEENIEVKIKIGSDEDGKMPKDCSMVTATYSAGGVNIGTYGVIGPLRMDYQKVVTVLEGVGKILEDILSNKN